MEKINTNLSELADGALQERFDHAVAQVTENILDINTDQTKKRKITITLTIASLDDIRDQMVMSAEVKTTLAPRDPVGTRVLIEGNGQDVFANELKSGQKGQMFFDPADSRLKDDQGKPVEEIEKEEKQQQAKSGEIIRFTDDKKSQTN